MDKWKLEKLRQQYEEARMALFSEYFPKIEITYQVMCDMKKEYFAALDEMSAKERERE